MYRKDPTNQFYTTIDSDNTKHIMSSDVHIYEYLCGKDVLTALSFCHWTVDDVCEECIVQYVSERLREV